MPNRQVLLVKSPPSSSHRKGISSRGFCALATLLTSLGLSACVETRRLSDAGEPPVMSVDAAMTADGGLLGDAGVQPSDAGTLAADGGTAPVDAGPDGGPISPCPPCEGETPHCEAGTGQCVACLDDSHCDSTTPACQPGTQECVACLEDTHCDPEVPACDQRSLQCVGCLDDSHCGGETPVCDASTQLCVGCLNDSHCTESAPFCNTGAQVCEQCRRDNDCTGAGAARCSAGSCTGCNNSSQCASVAGRGVCDRDAGRCVECTSDERAVCGVSACRSDHVCSDFGLEQRVCEPCDDNSNCETTDSDCVGTRADAYCMVRASVGTCPIQMSVERTASSVSSSISHTYCDINSLSSCEAVLATIDRRSCTEDADCGPQGRCRTVQGVPNRCSYDCTRVSDCEAGNAYCPSGPMYCPAAFLCTQGVVIGTGTIYERWLPNVCGGAP